MTYVLTPGDRPQIEKDAQASLIYGVDVADVLAAGDTLAGEPTATTAAGASISVSNVIRSGTVVSARVAGGNPGQVDPLTFSWQTAQGDTDQRTIFLRIVER